MSKPPRYVGLLIALVFTALSKLPANGAEQQPATPSEATPAEAATPSTPPAASAIPAEQTQRRPIIERYQDGIVIWEAPSDAQVPFLLRFNLNTQVRYLTATDSEETFTAHLGVVREVNTRND